MKLRYKLNLDTIDAQKLQIELNMFFNYEYQAGKITETEKKEYFAISNILSTKDKLYVNDILYNIFIGFYLQYFDKRMRQTIGNFGLYTRNDEQITIKFSLDKNNDSLLNSVDCGALSATKPKYRVIEEIKDILDSLATKYIRYEKVSYRALENLPYEDNPYVTRAE